MKQENEIRNEQRDRNEPRNIQKSDALKKRMQSSFECEECDTKSNGQSNLNDHLSWTQEDYYDFYGFKIAMKHRVFEEVATETVLETIEKRT